MTALKALLDTLEADLALFEPLRLRERSQALDRLERALDFAAYDPLAAGEQARMQALRARLEILDRALYGELREDIRHGGTRLLEWAAQTGGAATGEHYDHLDELVSGVLRLPPPSDDVGALGEEMVFYQPTPARHAFDLLRRLSLGADDVLIDLGAGLGHVPLLVAACTGAHAHGIEIEPAYVASARACAAELGLDRASFACTDAREAGLDAGSVYYLYTPFTGAILRQVLDALAQQAKARSIRVCTLGPCTPVVAAEPWLIGEDALYTDRIALFRSR